MTVIRRCIYASQYTIAMLQQLLHPARFPRQHDGVHHVFIVEHPRSVAVRVQLKYADRSLVSNCHLFTAFGHV